MEQSKDVYKYAGFGSRFLAVLIDGILLGIVAGILTASMSDSDSTRNSVSTIIGALYTILMWVQSDGQTLGKKAMGIKVIQADGKPVTYQTAIIRYIGYFISGFVLFLGFIWVLFDEKKQGWHDKIAKTYVVKA